MKGNTLDELIDIIARTGEATFLYKKEEYQILSDVDPKDKSKIIYSIWKAVENKNPIPLVEYSFDVKDEYNPKCVVEFLNTKGFAGNKSFMDCEADIEVTYHG